MRELLLLVILTRAIVPGFAADTPRDYAAHEWGTFTSVQGGDGVLVPWHASQIGDLPAFVYNWNKPGLNRQPTPILFGGKGGLTTLQRMETPVIYFYTDAEVTVEVEARFPKGFITEWFPQATQIGPALIPTNLASAATATATEDSLIHWREVRVLPLRLNREAANRIPEDPGKTHYLSARETESAFVRVNNLSPTNHAEEFEKFLFYRGSGNFSTPLVVTTSDDGTVTVENTGATPLAHLFLLQVHEGRSAWAKMETLGPRAKQVWQKLNSAPAAKRLAPEEFKAQVGSAMIAALVGAGLYPAEAKAMVKTWSTAWFSEAGTRVLYLLPRGWTDEILPLKLDPQPRELIRVMVGRAEIITPQAQKELADQIARANTGDAAAKEWLGTYAKTFGRFAPPASQLANQYLSRQANKPFATAARN